MRTKKAKGQVFHFIARRVTCARPNAAEQGKATFRSNPEWFPAEYDPLSIYYSLWGHKGVHHCCLNIPRHQLGTFPAQVYLVDDYENSMNCNESVSPSDTTKETMSKPESWDVIGEFLS
jgi:hypothetical protein